MNNKILKKQQDGTLYHLTSKQHREVKAMVNDCANYYENNCLLLDDGETTECPQKHSDTLCCTYFQEAVLPTNEALEADIFHDRSMKRCHICGCVFVPKSNRAKYCPDCAAAVRRKQKAEHERNRRKNMDI